MTLSLVFGTVDSWQAALVFDDRHFVAGFYDSLNRPNLQGAIATVQVNEVRGPQAFATLPDGEEGWLEKQKNIKGGDRLAVRVGAYVVPGKAWPLKVLDNGAPAGVVAWHDAAPSVAERAAKLYNIDTSMMSQDDDLIVDTLALHQGRENLKDGASLVIEQTVALTTIDINTGRLLGAANIIGECGGGIAETLRRYDLGGMIVIDAAFLAPSARRGLADKVSKQLADDPLQPKVISVTKMGLIEIIRPRMGPSLLEIL
ncbi:MAG: ribonuclease E/G [Bdellovibrionales bacterium]